MVLVFFRKSNHKCLDLEENVCTHLVRIPNACIGYVCFVNSESFLIVLGVPDDRRCGVLLILTELQGRHAVFALKLFAQVGRSETHLVGNG